MYVTFDGPIEIVVGTDAVAVRGLPAPPAGPAGSLFPFNRLQLQGDRFLLVDRSPAGLASFVDELRRAGLRPQVTHVFGPVGLDPGTPKPQRRGAQHTF